MKQKVFTTILILVIVGLLSAVVLGSRNNKDDIQIPTEVGSSVTPTFVNSQVPIFFYGNACPHCADVEKWMEENGIEEKIEIVKKEVYDNRANSLEMTEVAKSCGLPINSIGVPFLYTHESKCLIGSPDIINYLSDKADISADNKNTESGKEDEL